MKLMLSLIIHFNVNEKHLEFNENNVFLIIFYYEK